MVLCERLQQIRNDESLHLLCHIFTGGQRNITPWGVSEGWQQVRWCIPRLLAHRKHSTTQPHSAPLTLLPSQVPGPLCFPLQASPVDFVTYSSWKVQTLWWCLHICPSYDRIRYAVLWCHLGMPNPGFRTIQEPRVAANSCSHRPSISEQRWPRNKWEERPALLVIWEDWQSARKQQQGGRGQEGLPVFPFPSLQWLCSSLVVPGIIGWWRERQAQVCGQCGWVVLEMSAWQKRWLRHPHLPMGSRLCQVLWPGKGTQHPGGSNCTAEHMPNQSVPFMSLS